MVFSCLSYRHSSRKLLTSQLTSQLLKLPNSHINKTKEYIKVLSKSKSAIPPLFNVPEVLPSASDEVKLFAKNPSSNSNLDDSGIPLPVLPPQTNLKLHNISVTPMSIKKSIINVWFLQVVWSLLHCYSGCST